MSTTTPPPRDDIPKLADLPLAIDTPRLQLRPIAETDVDGIFEHAKDPELPRFMTWQAHRDRDETRAWIANQQDLLLAGTDVTWTIRRGSELAGTISLLGVRWHLRAWRVDRAEVGYWVAPPLHGQGIATEAGQVVMRWAFETLGLHRLTIGCIEDNKASKRVIEKLGFRYVGREEESLFNHGRWWNHLRYELTISEWGDSARTQRFNRPSRPL